VNDLHEQFANEARELIRQATDDLIALERDGPSPERIDRVFRAFHTLKGSAGVVELPTLSIVMHAAEDLLAAVRRGGLDASADIIDQALACLDLVSRWIGEFEDAGSLTPQADGDGRVMVERLQSLLPRETAPSARKPQPAASDAPWPEWVSVLIIAERDALASRLAMHSSVLFAISYEPIAGCFFNGDDPLQLMRQLPDMLAFRVESREAFPPVANLDPYACNLRLQAISGGGQDEIRKIFRLVPDQVRISSIPEEALSVGAASASDAKGPLIGKVIEAQAELLRVPNRSNDFAGCVGAAARSAINALRHGNYPQLAETVESAKALALSQRDAAPLLVALERALLAVDGVDGMRTPEAAEEDVDGSIAVDDAAQRPAQRVLRVSEVKIEALVNLAGELVVAKNALAHSAKRVEQEFTERAVIDLIWRDHQVIDRLVLELHSSILQLRMVPAGQVFQSFPRLVRDVSRQLGKKVDLVTRGESTEADKTIVDRLFEPLVHLVRNAVDHGIEIPGERLAAGKSETATVSIEASRIGDRVLIKVVDDGRGIDLDVVRRKVSEKRMMPPEELAALTDEQVVELIFAPGFSTTSEVSDISGRGIGMDVVRSAVEQLGGRVSLQSRAGFGTTVQIDLPTTIAMSRIMVVETAGQLFGISMDAVSETVRVTPDRIRQIKNNNGFLFRDRVVPIVALAELMKLPAPSNDSTVAKLLVVIEAAGKIAALEIEAIQDRLDVVLKPMQGLLAGARGYAGTTLLGSGQVLLVLDIKELLP
jgi:two-component system, chemotaxis family, sensor kinase CheA